MLHVLTVLRHVSGFSDNVWAGLVDVLRFVEENIYYLLNLIFFQYALRSKALNGDMTKYSCFQGYFNMCCCKAGECGEQSCPELCLFLEACCCNCLAVSATRIYVMEKYDLTSDPCDYRLIRINNCLQILACVCDILAIFDESFRAISQLIDRIADLFYHMLSGCMTAQVAHELNYQYKAGNMNGKQAPVVEYGNNAPQYIAPQQPQYVQSQPPQQYGQQQQQPVYGQPVQYGQQQQPYAGQPQYGQPQYGQPQYGQPQPQYGQPQPQYAQAQPYNNQPPQQQQYKQQQY